jgi:hypothetical protein
VSIEHINKNAWPTNKGPFLVANARVESAPAKMRAESQADVRCGIAQKAPAAAAAWIQI